MAAKTGVEEIRLDVVGLPGHVADRALVYIAYLDGREVFRSPLREEAERRLGQRKQERDQANFVRNAEAADRIEAEANRKAAKQ